MEIVESMIEPLDSKIFIKISEEILSLLSTNHNHENNYHIPLRKFIAFSYHQIGINRLPVGNFILLLQSFENLLRCFAEKDDMINFFASVRAISTLILWKFVDEINFEELQEAEQLSILIPQFYDLLFLKKFQNFSDDSFDFLLELRFLQNLLKLCSNSLNLAEACTEISKVVQEMRTVVDNDYLKFKFTSLSSELSNKIIKISTVKNESFLKDPDFGQVLILKVLFALSFNSSHYFLLFRTWFQIQNGMENWKLACVAVDCLKELILQPIPLNPTKKESRTIMQRSALITDKDSGEDSACNLQSLSMFSIQKQWRSYFAKDHLFHNWWIRYKVTEGIMLILNDPSLKAFYPDCSRIFTQLQQKEERSFLKNFIGLYSSSAAQRKDILLQLRKKWTVFGSQEEAQKELSYSYRMDIPEFSFKSDEDYISFAEYIASVPNESLKTTILIRFIPSFLHEHFDNFELFLMKYLKSVLVVLKDSSISDEVKGLYNFHQLFDAMTSCLMKSSRHEPKRFPVRFCEMIVGELFDANEAAEPMIQLTASIVRSLKDFIQSLLNNCYKESSFIEEFIFTINSHCTSTNANNLFDFLFQPTKSTSYVRSAEENTLLALEIIKFPILSNWIYNKCFHPVHHPDLLQYFAKSSLLPLEIIMVLNRESLLMNQDLLKGIAEFLHDKMDSFDADGDNIYYQLIVLIASSYTRFPRVRLLFTKLEQLEDKFKLDGKELIIKEMLKLSKRFLEISSNQKDSKNARKMSFSIENIIEWSDLLIKVEIVENESFSSIKEVLRTFESVSFTQFKRTEDFLVFVSEKLGDLYFQCLMGKFPQNQNLNEVSNRFLQEKYPLTVEELEALIKIMMLIELRSEELQIKERFTSHHKVNEFFMEKKKYWKTEMQGIDSIIFPKVDANTKATPLLTEKYRELLVPFVVDCMTMLRHAVYLTKGFYPFPIQVLVVLALFFPGSHPSKFFPNAPPVTRGRLAQVLTGQGKSVIIAMLTGLFVIAGHKVDIISSSKILAKRDARVMKSFYALIGQSTVCHCCSDKLTFTDNFEADIVYGTVYSVEFAYLKDISEDSGIRNDHRPFDLVIVDEVDSMFIDRLDNSTRIVSKSVICAEVSWVYGFLMDQTEKDMDKVTENLLNSEKFKKCTPSIQTLIRQLLPIWIYSLSKAKAMTLNHQYAIRNHCDIVPIDRLHTGELNPNAHYSGGVEQMIEYKEGIMIPSLDRMLAATLCHISLFQKYHRIYGLTGTMGGDVERNDLKLLYRLDTFDVPVHVPGKREEYDPMYFLNGTAMLNSMMKEANEISIRRGRPVLILFSTISETELFYTQYLELYLNKNDNGKIQVFNGLQTETEEEEILARAGKAGMITVATNIAGRGTDIVTWEEAERNGGTHVIIGFHPINIRVENQAKGRTARQGKQGSIRLMIVLQSAWNIAYSPNITKVSADLAAYREKTQGALSLQRRFIDVPYAILEDEITEKFCSQLRNWKSSVDEYCLQGIKSQWYNWFNQMDMPMRIMIEKETRPKIIALYNSGWKEKDGLPEVIKEFQVHLQRIQNEFDRFMITVFAQKDDYRNIPLGQLLSRAMSLQTSNPKKALEIFDQILTINPYYPPVFINRPIVSKAARVKCDVRTSYQQAVEAIERNLSINPTWVQQFEWLKHAYRNLRSKSDEYNTSCRLADVLYSGKRYLQSVKECDYALTLDNDDEKVYFLRARANMMLENYEEALKDAKISQSKGNITTAVELMVQINQKAYGKFDPSHHTGFDYNSLCQYADTLYSEKNYAESLQKCDQAINIRNDDEKAYFLRARAKMMLRKYEEAMEDAKTSQLKGNNTTVHELIVKIYNSEASSIGSKSDYIGAKKKLTLAIRYANCFPTTIPSETLSSVYSDLGNICEIIQEYPEALSAFEEAIKINDTNQLWKDKVALLKTTINQN